MDEQMFSYFPDGLRTMLVDDDTKSVRSASSLLSLLHFKVVETCPNPNAGLRVLSRDNPKNIHVILCDARKVAASGFDFRDVVESELRIPVIYFLSPTNQAAGNDPEPLDRILRTATYIVGKPLDASELTQLWRVVAWRKHYLDGRVRPKGDVVAIDDMTAASRDARAGGGDGVSSGSVMMPLLSAGAGGDGDCGAPMDVDQEERAHFKAVRSGASASGSSSRKRQHSGSDDGNGGGGAGSPEPQKHRLMWTPRLKQKFESAVKHVGIDGHPSKILEHMNVKGLERQHVASHLQKYRAKQQKSLQERRHALEHSSLFLKAILPTLNVPAYSPHHVLAAGGAGPSNHNVLKVAAFTTAGNDNNGAGCSAPPQLWRAPAAYPAQSQQPAGGGNVAVSVGNAAPAAAVQVREEGQQPQQQRRFSISSGGGGQLPAFPVVPKMFFGPFPYQGPLPPNMEDKLGMMPAPLPAPLPAQVAMEQPEPEIQLPVGGLLAGATANGGTGADIAAYSGGALQNNGAAGDDGGSLMDAVFSASEPIMATNGTEGHDVYVAPEENAAALAAAEAAAIGAASNNGELFMMPDQVLPAGEVAAGEDDDFTFPLEELLGLDDDIVLPMDVGDGAGAEDAAVAATPNGEDRGWDLSPETDFFLEELLMSTPDDDIADLNYIAGRE